MRCGGFADAKLELMGAIAAISAVELLQAFIHLTFSVSGVLFAVSDGISEARALNAGNETQFTDN
jgi:hypothetical protein